MGPSLRGDLDLRRAQHAAVERVTAADDLADRPGLRVLRLDLRAALVARGVEGPRVRDRARASALERREERGPRRLDALVQAPALVRRDRGRERHVEVVEHEQEVGEEALLLPSDRGLDVA